MSTHHLAPIDNRDDRTEIFYLLSKLSPLWRTRFLDYCVKRVNRGIMLTHRPPWVLLRVWNETGELNETYLDLMLIATQFQLPVHTICNDLTMLVRTGSFDRLSAAGV